MTEHKRPLKRGFAHKKSVAIAIEMVIVKMAFKGAGIEDRFHAAMNKTLPAGDSVKLALKLIYEQDKRMIELAMTNAPLHDSDAMVQRMSWLVGRKRTSATE